MKNKLDHLYVGFAFGMIGPVLGFMLFYLIMFNHKPFSGFLQMILNNSDTHAGIISVSLVFNLIFFFIALRNDWYNAARGVIMAMFVYAPFVVYFKYVA
ncbi:MAG: hypothetical protein R2813_13490 [Flavobacteriales bacterium]